MRFGVRGGAALLSTAVAVAMPAGAAMAGLDELTLKVETKEHQRAADLSAKVECVEDPCDVTITGKARASGHAFALKPKGRSLAANEQERFRLRIKRLRKLEELLAESDGTATVKVRAVNAAGAVAKVKSKVRLTG
jgi:hypothetical protein